MSEAHRCLVVEGQPITRLGIQRLLSERYEVEEATDGDEALQLLTAGDFDVAVIELARSRSNSTPGTTTIKALRKAQPGLGIVAHGPRAERHAIAEAMAAGATAFACKSSQPEQLFRAVDAAIEAETFIDSPADAPGAADERTLTRRQREILQLYADGCSTDKTAKRLGLSPETVRTHTKAALARLEARDRAHAVAIALRGSIID